MEQRPSFTGLSATEVRERVSRGETNDYQARVGRSYWDILRDNLFNLFNIVLFTLLIIVLLFRDYATVFFAGFSVVSNSLLGMFQEIAAKRKLDQMAALQVKETRAYRDGQIADVPVRELVKDDVIVLQPGERLPVDGVVLHSDALEMDESQLTGESDAVLKEKDSLVHSGSFCVAGTGVIRATAVGKHSQVNQLSKIAKAYKHVLTPTQIRINLLVQLSVLIMAIVLPMVFIAGFSEGRMPLEVFRNAVVFVTSLVPQGLVLTAILALTLGALSITRHQTLIQRVNAVESMANVTVLCFDKTGTLTRNQLAVHEIIPVNGTAPGQIDSRLVNYLGNLGHMNLTASAVAEHLQHKNRTDGTTPSVMKVREVPFTSARKWGAIVLNDETLIMGAPERVLAHDKAEHRPLIEQAKTLAAEGMRVLAFAHTPIAPTDNLLDPNREPVALIVLSDRVREDIRETLNAFTELGVGLKVISGDNIETVRSIATQAGMKVNLAYTGDQLESMSEGEFDTAAKEAAVFARIEPDTKRKLIASLKKQGEYVAMVGDGVNDVPALKEAHLAIVMNDGAQITKDVGDIVLLNNAMSTLPLAFREGREITQTIFGTSKMFLLKNFYSLFFFLFAGFMSLPFPINPIQISWLTFGVINLPATLIAFRVLRPAYMTRFRGDVLDYVITGGIIGSAAMSLLYAVSYFASGENVDEARSAVTIFLSLYGMLAMWHIQGIELMRLATIRARFRDFIIGLVLGSITIAIPYLLPLFWPSVAGAMRFTPPEPQILAMIGALWLLVVILLESAMRGRAITKRLWALFAP